MQVDLLRGLATEDLLKAVDVFGIAKVGIPEISQPAWHGAGHDHYLMAVMRLQAAHDVGNREQGIDAAAHRIVLRHDDNHDFAGRA